MSGTAPRDTLTPIAATDGRTVYYDDDRGTYHTWCEDGAYEPVSTALLMTVSSVLGLEPDDLEALSECVEPDALNASSFTGAVPTPAPATVDHVHVFAVCRHGPCRRRTRDRSGPDTRRSDR